MNVENPKLAGVTQELALEGFEPRYGERAEAFGTNPLWAQMKELGSELWLDTGDMDAAGTLWTREFSALTTNNTLLNKEVQKGAYDELVRRSARVLRETVPGLDETSLVREIAFVLNARHGLRLVEKFDAFVSVEEHTDAAHDVEAAAGYARRYHAICPERFIVKIPLTAEGLLAARRVGAEGIPVNLTLGFSARQNVLIAVFARPKYCNVFLGRLNSVVSEHKLGDGRFVGEKATVASQNAVAAVGGSATRQIAASIRSGQQVGDLAGTDVLTIPPKAAEEFIGMPLDPADLARGADGAFEVAWAEGVEPDTWGLNSLWDVSDGLGRAALDIASKPALDGPALRGHLAGAGFAAVLPEWSEADAAKATEDGKIPNLPDWRDRLSSGEVGLDALMNLHGLRSFVLDQKAMDGRIRGLV